MFAYFGLFYLFGGKFVVTLACLMGLLVYAFCFVFLIVCVLSGLLDLVVVFDLFGWLIGMVLVFCADYCG